MERRLGTSMTVAVIAAVAGMCSVVRASGPDVLYSNIGDLTNHGQVGGIYAFSLGTSTCNIGDQNLLWTNNGTPGVGWGMYRLKGGRLEQIGLSWVKRACCAGAGAGCNLACNGQGGSVLGVGCMDVYGSGYNAGQTRLAQRSSHNPYTGAFGTFNTSSGDAIYKRLQAAGADMDPLQNSAALYFVEGVYIGTDDATNFNHLNNASYKQVTFNAALSMSLAGSIFASQPAIRAWRDHGNGINNPDTSVTINTLDVPSEGRFYTGYKVTCNGNGTWRYEYAIFNLTSDKAGGSFSVPIPAGTTITNAGFHDVNYHSGEVYDNTNWTVNVGASSVSWYSPQTFGQNPNSNALRWGTMYNFWFDANRPPRMSTALTLGLFKPHTPQSVTFTALALPACPADVDPPAGDGQVNINDLLGVINAWGPCSAACACPADATGDGQVNINDLLGVINAWGPCP